MNSAVINIDTGQVDLTLETPQVTVDEQAVTIQVASQTPAVEVEVEQLEVLYTLNQIETEATVDTPTVTIGVPGPQGIPGSAGGFRHTQASPSASWVITHNLGRKPAVTIVLDTLGHVTSDITYTSDNSLTVTFPVAVTGTADM